MIFLIFWKPFLITIHKKWIREWPMNLFLLLLMVGLKVRILSNLWITLSYNFFWNYHQEFQELSSGNRWNWCIFWKLFLWKQDSGDFKSVFKVFRSLFYQMDHIWGAPHGLKKSLRRIFLEKLARTFGPEFSKTLYESCFVHMSCRHVPYII